MFPCLFLILLIWVLSFAELDHGSVNHLFSQKELSDWLINSLYYFLFFHEFLLWFLLFLLIYYIWIWLVLIFLDSWVVSLFLCVYVCVLALMTPLVGMILLLLRHCFYVVPEIFLLLFFMWLSNHSLTNCLNFHNCVYLLEITLLSVLSLIALWSDRIQGVISIFMKLWDFFLVSECGLFQRSFHGPLSRVYVLWWLAGILCKDLLGPLLYDVI